MRISKTALAPCLALLLLAACDQAPKGPVAATVDGEQISVAELEAEMKAANVPNAADPQVRTAVLERVIARKLMAKAARDEKLDATPEAKALQNAAVENVQASLTQQAVLAKVATPTAAEAQAYMDANPAMFAKRKLYLVDILQLDRPPSAAIVEALRPIDDFEQIARLLNSQNVPFRRGAEQFDALRMQPGLATQIAAVPPGIPFVMPAPPGMAIVRVRASKDAPALGPEAVTFAQQLLTTQRKQKAVTDRLKALTDAAKAKTTYGQGFGPPAKGAGT